VIPATEALERLRDGNRRFASDRLQNQDGHQSRRAQLTAGQNPFAIILGCSDSRVPAEIVFDQGLGDLFVIRVAGNIAQPSQIGSVEFAASQFGTRLVVVLGHSMCGAVQAVVENLQGSGTSDNLGSIIDLIRPSVASLIADGHGQNPDTLAEKAVRANIHASAERLRHGSAIIEKLERDDGLVIVGAEYSLDTGLVDFFDGVPEA
jgi:carbonic anhydrase